MDDWPLALCDGSYLRPGDLVETDHIRRGYAGATMNLLHRDWHKWFYLSRQTKEEIVFFKNFDSLSEVKAQRMK